MKQFSHRTWVLLFGIAVATAIALALISKGGEFSNTPEVTQKPAPANPTSTLLKKLAEPIFSRVRL